MKNDASPDDENPFAEDGLPDNVVPLTVASDSMPGRPQFAKRAGGIYFLPKPDAEDYAFLCPRIDVLALTRNEASEAWGRLVTFRDPDGVEHRLPVAMADVSGTDGGGDVLKQLARAGFDVPLDRKRKNLLLSYLASERPEKRFRSVDRLGWSRDAFVLPDRSYGADDADEVLWQPEGGQPDHAFRQQGTLEDWQAGVASLAEGNSRLILSLSLAFAGALMLPFGEEGGGVHLRGSSSTGKTTALHLTASVWGEPGAFVRTWRATDNGLESVCSTHNDTLLPLDELGQASAHAASAAAYMLSNGVGKTRASRSGGARKSAAWRVLFLSTGELSLSGKVQEEGRGRRVKAGQEVRVLDIPADAGAGLGLFDRLNGASSGAAMSELIKSRASESYGTAGRAFVERLVREDRDTLRQQYDEARTTFLDELLADHPDASGQVRRAAARFALIGIAGELAIAFGVLPFEAGAAKDAAARCFQDWLRERGSSEAAETREAVERVRSFVTSQPARFQSWGDDMDPPNDPPRDLAGYRRTGDRQEAGFYILPSIFRDEVCAGLDPRLAADVLTERGYLRRPTDGKPSGKHKPPAARNSSGLRLYHITPTITGEAEG